LHESEREKAERISQLEAQANGARAEADGLREQLDANEQAVTDLQEKLDARESELESLRAHFDLEAADLKKRAEQEMWLVRHRVQRIKRLAAVGGALAACFIVLFAFMYFGAASDASRTQEKLAQVNAMETDNAPLPDADDASDRFVREDAPTPEEAARRVIPIVLPARTDEDEPAADAAETPAPETPAASVRWHTVARNDNLWDLSKEYLGTGARWKEIAEANGIDTRSPRSLRLGERLRMPPE